MSSIRFVQTQHPVGQGGFHTGRLYICEQPFAPTPHVHRRLFDWIYDCGSDQTSSLDLEVLRVRARHIDTLFLSHLDRDHVSGVDTLLTTVAGVDQVVLPYLGDDDWAAILGAGASAGKLSGTLVDLAEDPAGWFGRRGVGRVVYVDGFDDDDDEGPEADPLDPDGRDPDTGREDGETPERLKIVWSRQPRSLDADDSGAFDTERAETIVVERGAVASVTGAGGTLNWVFSPFAFRPSRTKMAAFSAKLASEFVPGMTAAAYAAEARTPAGRLKLRKCYDAVWTTHNLHSMALYAGPAVRMPGLPMSASKHGSFLRRHVEPGWLSTGDFDLSVKKRRDHLIRFYNRYADLVGQLSLPHHGSEHSFDVAILAALPRLTSALAAVGPNSHGHPSISVQRTVSNKRKMNFVRVDENPSSSFVVKGPVT